jgi:hypothetical protein
MLLKRKYLLKLNVTATLMCFGLVCCHLQAVPADCVYKRTRIQLYALHKTKRGNTQPDTS